MNVVKEIADGQAITLKVDGRPGTQATMPTWISGADGEIPFVFYSKPRGQRCLWLARWETSVGVIEPNAIITAINVALGQTDLSDAQLRAAYLDVTDAPGDVAELTRQARQPLGPGERAKIKRHLSELTIPPTVCPTDIPSNLIRVYWRRGWRAAGAQGQEL